MNTENKETFLGILDIVQKLSAITEATAVKVEALAGSNGSPQSEPTEQRISNERSKRLKESADRQIRRSAENGSRPTNAARREETAKRFTELRSPSVPTARPSARPAVSGIPIEFYAWKEGEMGKIEILAGSDFKPL